MGIGAVKSIAFYLEVLLARHAIVTREQRLRDKDCVTRIA